MVSVPGKGGGLQGRNFLISTSWAGLRILQEPWDWSGLRILEGQWEARPVLDGAVGEEKNASWAARQHRGSSAILIFAGVYFLLINTETWDGKTPCTCFTYQTWLMPGFVPITDFPLLSL